MGPFKHVLEILRGARRKAKKNDNTKRASKATSAIKALFPPPTAPVIPKPKPKPEPKPKPSRPTDLPAMHPALVHVRQQSLHGPSFGLGECQLQCRTAYGFPSVGDFDGDGDADAEDAYKAAKVKHPGDLNVPRGYPLFWGGGSHDNGHVAISAGDGFCWSTDILRAGRFDKVPISLIHAKWGLPYLGWVEDYCGHEIAA